MTSNFVPFNIASHIQIHLKDHWLSMLDEHLLGNLGLDEAQVSELNQWMQLG